MNLKLISLAVAACISLMTPTYAFEANYTTEDSKLNISGSVNAADVVVAVMPYEYKANELTVDLINNNDDVLFYHTNAEGDYNTEILLSLSFPLGKYRVSEIVERENSDLVFFKLSETRLSDAVVAINNAQNGAEAGDAIITLLADMDESLKAKAASIGTYMYIVRPRLGYDAQSFLESFTLYEGIVTLKNKEIYFSNFMNEYSSVMDNSVKISYSALTDNQVRETEGIINNIKFEKRRAEEIIEDIILTACARTATNYEDLKALVLAYWEDSDTEPIGYDGLSEYEQNTIFIEIFTNRSKITNPDYITNEVKRLIDAANTPDIPLSPPLGGGVGGGYTVVEKDITEESPLDTVIFSDVVEHWAKNDIAKMYALGIVSGVGDNKFEPDRQVTRAEFVKMLLGTLGLNISDVDCSFSDVSKDKWYYKYVANAVKLNIVKGVSAIEFGAERAITREDASTMVYRAINEKLNKFGSYDYIDTREISNYATESVAYLSKAGIIKGSDGYFRPKEDITRAEAAVLLLRVHNLR